MPALGYAKKFKVNTIKSIWGLKERYYSYHIFVWLENEGDMDAFTNMSFCGIKVEGFCNDLKEERIESFFNKQVVDINFLVNEDNVIIVYGKDDSRRKYLQENYSVGNILFLSFDELFEIRDEMREKETIILYDSVRAARHIERILCESGVKVAGSSAVRERDANNIFPEKKKFDKRELSDDKYNVVLASSRTYCEESILCLQDNGINIFVPSKDIFYSSVIISLWGKMALNLNRALEKKKKIYLYGIESCYTNNWLSFLNLLDIKVEQIVDDCENAELSISSVYDLVYQDPSDVFIILNKKIGHWESSCDLLESLGFAFNKMYTGLYSVAYRHLPKLTDIILGHVTSELLMNTKYEGFRVYGEEREGNYKIVTLGGSTTTSEAYRVLCWPELLYNKLNEEGYNVVIYNGAVDGYSAADELHKLIRDAGCLRPDLVISFSGVNNRFKTPYPYVSGYLLNVFNEIYEGNFCRGLKNEALSVAQIWIQQEQMMAEISRRVYQADFLCFAQPMYMTKKVLLPCEKLQFEKNAEIRRSDLIYREEISRAAEQFDWMIDLQGYLDEYPNVFLDEAHLYEEGNQMISEEIYKYIIRELPRESKMDKQL